MPLPFQLRHGLHECLPAYQSCAMSFSACPAPLQVHQPSRLCFSHVYVFGPCTPSPSHVSVSVICIHIRCVYTKPLSRLSLSHMYTFASFFFFFLVDPLHAGGDSTRNKRKKSVALGGCEVPKSEVIQVQSETSKFENLKNL